MYTLMPTQWGHEKVTATRMGQPTEEDLVPVVDAEGNPQLLDDGAPAMMLRPDFQPTVEQVELDTITVLDREGSTVVKIVLGDAFAQFLNHYVQFLNPDGRQLLRNTLEETSGLVIPDIVPPRMDLIKGKKS